MKKVLTTSLVLFSIVFLSGCSQQQTNKTRSNNQSPTKQGSSQSEAAAVVDRQTSSSTIDIPSSWKTYTYKNLSFNYPENWVVVFDSKVAGQPNGFSLHVMRDGDSGLQPDELGLSTYNNRASTPDDYIANEKRLFGQRQRGDGYIEFNANGTVVYAGCAYYSKGEETRDICDKIVKTVTIE